jgi:hypothetical protein
MVSHYHRSVRQRSDGRHSTAALARPGAIESELPEPGRFRLRGSAATPRFRAVNKPLTYRTVLSVVLRYGGGCPQTLLRHVGSRAYGSSPH